VKTPNHKELLTEPANKTLTTSYGRTPVTKMSPNTQLPLSLPKAPSPPSPLESMLKNGNSKKEVSNPEIVEKNLTTVSYSSDKKKDHPPNKSSRTLGEKNGERTDKSDSLLTRRTKLSEECAEF